MEVISILDLAQSLMNAPNVNIKQWLANLNSLSNCSYLKAKSLFLHFTFKNLKTLLSSQAMQKQETGQPD